MCYEGAAGLTEIVLVKQQVNPAGRADRRTAISLCWRDLSKTKSKYFASSEDTLTKYKSGIYTYKSCFRALELLGFWRNYYHIESSKTMSSKIRAGRSVVGLKGLVGEQTVSTADFKSFLFATNNNFIFLLSFYIRKLFCRFCGRLLW